MTPYTTGINALDVGELAERRSTSSAVPSRSRRLVGADRLRVYAGSWQPDDSDHAGPLGPAASRPCARWRPKPRTPGCALCVENHFGTMTQSAAETARLVREVDHPAVRVLYDQANLTFTHDEPYEEALRIQGDLVGHVHVKDLVFTDPDAPFRASETARVEASEERAVRSRVVGDGVVPWADILVGAVRRSATTTSSRSSTSTAGTRRICPIRRSASRESAAALRAILARRPCAEARDERAGPRRASASSAQATSPPSRSCRHWSSGTTWSSRHSCHAARTPQTADAALGLRRRATRRSRTCSRPRTWTRCSC